jgi:hypothetical protein
VGDRHGLNGTGMPTTAGCCSADTVRRHRRHRRSSTRRGSRMILVDRRYG